MADAPIRGNLRAMIVAFLIATAAMADPAGPPRPIDATRTPVEQAIAQQAGERAARAGAIGCTPTRGNDVLVCGGGRSPYRLPLPDERAPRRAPGEGQRADAGGAPVGHSGMAGVTVDVLALAAAATGAGGDAKIVTPGDAKPPH